MSIEDDAIEKLQRKLYSRNLKPAIDVRSEVSVDEEDVKNSWGSDPTLHITSDADNNSHTHPFLKKFLVISIIFFVICLGISAYVFFGGSNSISSNNVDVNIAGPSSIASGQEVDATVTLINSNSTDLQFAQLTADYPPGSFADADSATPLTHVATDIGTIAKGASVTEPIKVFLFGGKGDAKTINFTLQYQISGSNAVFTKEKDYDMSIASSPIILNVSNPTQVNSGQDITFQVSLASNSPSVLHDILVQANYPYGFTYESSSIPIYEGKNNEWQIGDMQTGGSTSFTITGKLIAQNGEQRTFNFITGSQSADPTKDIDTALASAATTLTVNQPFIETTLALGNDSTDSTIAVNAGSGTNATLNFTNTLPQNITAAQVIVNVSGSGLDPASVEPSNGGFYQSSNGSISWDDNSTPSLSQIAPSASTGVSFSLNTLSLGATAINPSVTISATVSGSETASDGSTQQVSSTVSKTIDVNADLMLNSRTIHNGPILNSGPTPPVAGTPTTYSVDWALTNMWNNVSGAEVSTTLPPYVDWTGQISPATADISYATSTRTVTWDPDSVSAGAGFNLSPKEVVFQLRLNPSLSQLGQAPMLTSTINVTAHDDFSMATLNFTSQALTTQTADTNDSGVVTN